MAVLPILQREYRITIIEIRPATTGQRIERATTVVMLMNVSAKRTADDNALRTRIACAVPLLRTYCLHQQARIHLDLLLNERDGQRDRAPAIPGFSVAGQSS